MSSTFNFSAILRQNQFIYHHASYTIETSDIISVSSIYYTPPESVASDDISNNSAVNIIDFLKFFVFDIPLSFFFSIFLLLWSAISLLWFSVQPFFHELYDIIVTGLYLLPHKFPILSSYPFPYSLWVVFLWFLDFLDFVVADIIIPTCIFLCTFLSLVYMLVFDLLLIPFQEI